MPAKTTGQAIACTVGVAFSKSMHPVQAISKQNRLYPNKIWKGTEFIMTLTRLRLRRTWLALVFGTLTQIGLFLADRQLPSAHAQSYSDDEVASYARAAASIETERLEAYELANDILTSADSELSIVDTPLNCTSTRLADMPDISRENRVDLRDVLLAFCNNASQVVEENDLTPKAFNEMTAAHRENAELLDRIKAAIAAL